MYTTMETSGFCVVKNFLSPDELASICENYSNTPTSPNKNYNVSIPSKVVIDKLVPKLNLLMCEIAKTTNIKATFLTSDTFYIDNKKNNFEWHQDSESYYVFQQSYNYINCYIPIIKETPTMAGLSLVPMDYLAKNHRELFFNVFNRGAQHFIVDGDRTKITDSERDLTYYHNINLDEVSVSPELAAGDLLLLRGDVIHRTQDTSSKRVAISIRYTDGDGTINKEQLFDRLSAQKKATILNNKPRYTRMLNYFETNGNNIATVKDLFKKENTGD